MHRVVVVQWNRVALRAELVVRRFIRLLEHARQVGTVRLVAVQAAALLRREIQRCLVLERERTHHFCVTTLTDVGAVIGQLGTRRIQAHMTLTALDDLVVDRVAEGPSEFSLEARMTTDAQTELGFLQQTGLRRSVHAVTAATVDVVVHMDIALQDVLLMCIHVT